MLEQLSDKLVPPGLRGPILVDQRGLPRYWAAVWATTSAAQLADSTHVKKLRYIENLYQHADQLRGMPGNRRLDDARLGGYLNRKHDRPLGPTVMWRGFRALHECTEMYRIFQQNE